MNAIKNKIDCFLGLGREQLVLAALLTAYPLVRYQIRPPVSRRPFYLPAGETYLLFKNLTWGFVQKYLTIYTLEL